MRSSFARQSTSDRVDRRWLTLAEPFLRIAAEMANQSLELFGRSREPLPVGAAQHQGHAEIAAAEVWVGADLDIGIPFLQLGEILRQSAFGEVAADAAAQHLVAAHEPIFQLLEYALHDARHAGKNIDIADLETRGTRDRVG